MKKTILLLFISNIFAHELTKADQAEMVDGGLLDYLYLGAKHMVTGYDHILFLIGVIFFLTKLSDIIKFVTAFTIGHSITLIFATFYKVTANYYLIDAVIALSVIYKGFENLDGFKKVFNRNAPNLIMMVLFFGLIHGFGLSTRLQQLPLKDESLLASIISFNVGVELGQVLALLIAFPFIRIIQKSKNNLFSKVTNLGLVLSGIGLFIFQITGYIENKNHVDEHQEIHTESMESQDTHVHDDGAVHQNHNSDDRDGSSPEPTGHSHDGENYHTH
jgi:hydrogenase/urease accessory protein HupE